MIYIAVKLFFGLPGAGKTTMMAYFAKKAVNKRSPYTYVYSNVALSIPGVIHINNSCVGKYKLTNCLLLLDEATLFADSRDYKNFSKSLVQFFLLHRHYKCDIILFTQQWDGVDKKIRVITDRVYYVYKSALFGKYFSSYYRIPYGIIIPDPNNKKGGSGEKLGDIIQGYAKPHWIVRLFSPKIFRPLYYKYFDSWDAPELPELPSTYQAYQTSDTKTPLFKRLRKKIFNNLKLPKFNVKKAKKASLSDSASDIIPNINF